MVTEIVTDVFERMITPSVEMVEAARLSFNGSCVGMMVTSVSLEYWLC